MGIAEYAYLEHPRTSTVRLGVSLRLSGEIDLGNAQDLKDALDERLDVGGPILIDVSELSFIDSAGVHVWVQAAESLNDRGCLVIHGERKSLGRLFDLLGVDDMVTNLHRVHHAS